ncbi:hypothetical protein SGL43_00335 [Streptomyces globisporus]|uniref:Uncharacterized protein n=1 Tax=Streptomyces globisporus TaxID=1908 RepID=A0ABM9GPN6_STRGL|nr:hypothetical protein SGL43_00335 [Streptomyces globisporus]
MPGRTEGPSAKRRAAEHARPTAARRAQALPAGTPKDDARRFLPQARSPRPEAMSRLCLRISEDADPRIRNQMLAVP